MLFLATVREDHVTVTASGSGMLVLVDTSGTEGLLSALGIDRAEVEPQIAAAAIEAAFGVDLGFISSMEGPFGTTVYFGR
jgi:hypothetical protein